MFKFFRFSTVAIVAITALQASTSAAALAKTKWVYVGKDSYKHFHLWVDTNSLKRKGNFVWFWFRGTSVEPIDPKLRIHFVDEYASINCQSGMIRFISTRSFDKDQKLLPEFSGDYKPGAVGPADWKNPAIRYACRR